MSSWDRVLGRLVSLSRSSWARARTRSSGTSSRSSCSSRSSSSRSSSSRSSFCLRTIAMSTCNTYLKSAQSNVRIARRRARREHLQFVCTPDAHAAGRPTVSQWSVTRARHHCMRVLQCESTCVADEARTRAACMTSVLCTRVVVCSVCSVCRAQRGERGRGSGEAKPGARHASLRVFCCLCCFCCTAKTRCVHKCACTSHAWLVCQLSLLGVAAATATPVATLHVDGHGAETFYGRSKRKKEEQNDGKAGSSRRASGRQW